MIKINFDGACGPKNPGGKCGGGAVILKDGKLLKEIVSEYVPQKRGQTSNNLGEFWGIIKALEFLKENGLQNEIILAQGDSVMVVNQMSGKWKVKTKKGYKIYTEVGLQGVALAKEFPHIRFEWIPREENEWADQLSKLAISKYYEQEFPQGESLY